MKCRITTSVPQNPAQLPSAAVAVLATTGDAIASKAAVGWKAATDWGMKRAENLGKVFDTAEDWRLAPKAN